MKNKLKYLICNLPMSIKLLLSTIRTLTDIKKVKIINKIKTKKSLKFTKLNSKEYKKNLKKCMTQHILSREETEQFINYLYNDELELIRDTEFDYSKPTIICVVKNEEDKLINFFEHYNKIGNFNYLFIDNNSTDNTLEILEKNNAKVYLCKEKFSTIRKLSWINAVYSTIENNSWIILLDADELLVYYNYEKNTFNKIIFNIEQKNINTCGAIMVDMYPQDFSSKEEYIRNYKYFQNSFHEEKSYLFNSVYGGIREREFNTIDERNFLIKKHPIVKKDEKNLLIHCHYIYPFDRNVKSNIYFALLHYKLFDKEIKKYQKIAEEGSYGGGSIEYKMYLEKLKKSDISEIFKKDKDTCEFLGTESLKKIEILHDVNKIKKE